MLEHLEQRLQPGETVIYRAPRRWEPDAWFSELVIYGACLALLWAGGVVRFESPGLWALLGALAPPALHTLWVYQRDWSTAALVTNRRLLHRQGWLRAKVIEILVRRVAAVEAEVDRIRVGLDDGSCVFLGHPQDAWGLGVALAHSAGIPLPDLPSRREIIARSGIAFCFLLITLAVSIAVLEWLLVHWGLLAFALLLPLVALLGAVTGLLLGGLLALVLGRPILSFDEVARCIASYDRLWLADGDESGLTWPGCLFLWLAERLYGRKTPPPGAKTAAGGE